MARKYLQVVETYDSFRPHILWSVDFRLVDEGEPRKINTFRSAYNSIREIYDGALTYVEQSKFSWMKEGREV